MLDRFLNIYSPPFMAGYTKSSPLSGIATHTGFPVRPVKMLKRRAYSSLPDLLAMPRLMRGLGNIKLWRYCISFEVDYD